MSDSRHTITFRLVNGAWFKLDLTADELSYALRAIDGGGVIGQIVDGQRKWYQCRHIVSVEYPVGVGVDWLEIRGEVPISDEPQEERRGDG